MDSDVYQKIPNEKTLVIMLRSRSIEANQQIVLWTPQSKGLNSYSQGSHVVLWVEGDVQELGTRLDTFMAGSANHLPGHPTNGEAFKMSGRSP